MSGIYAITAHEQLKPTEVPTDKWQILGTDLFSIGQDNYLIVADYFFFKIVIYTDILSTYLFN